MGVLIWFDFFWRTRY